jgi:GNAT superfamily N-acetyltransferase
VALRLREARFPEDEAACSAFIFALQVIENAIVPNRRLDDAVGGEYLAELRKQVAEHDGRIWIAEADGVAVGWCVAHDYDDDIYVRAELRRRYLVSELYVDERWRGSGAGQMLLQAAEDEARRRGRPALHIGVLHGNERAERAYARFGFRMISLSMQKPL